MTQPPSPPPRPLAGRTALVTGCSRRAGIGYAVAQRLGALGARLVIQGEPAFDEREYGTASGEPGRTLAALHAQGLEVSAVEASFLAPDAPAHLMRQAAQVLGRVDLLVANHAYSVSDTLETFTPQGLEAHLTVNVRATLELVQRFAAQLEGAGRVVLLTSGQDVGPMPDVFSYATSKAALAGIVPTLAHALARRGITVNAVDPGPTDTGWATPEATQAVRDASPQGRWGTPDDAARLIAWLCSNDAAWVTGQVIHSRGGF